MTSLCWRHSFRLHVLAFGTLLDISGRLYPRLARKVFDDAHKCPDCIRKSTT
jgi:hypothetical protein